MVGPNAHCGLFETNAHTVDWHSYAALRRLAAETAKAEAKLGHVSATSDESRTAIKGGLKAAMNQLKTMPPSMISA